MPRLTSALPTRESGHHLTPTRSRTVQLALHGATIPFLVVLCGSQSRRPQTRPMPRCCASSCAMAPRRQLRRVRASR